MEKSSLDKLAHVANMSHGFGESDLHVETDKEHNIGYRSSVNASASPELLSDYPQYKGKRVACTSCRQQKAKCDAADRQPQPCTRCVKKGNVCEIKPDFKRVGKRARLASIEREFAELKRSFQGPHVPHLATLADHQITSSSASPPSAETLQSLPSNGAYLLHNQHLSLRGPAFRDQLRMIPGERHTNDRSSPANSPENFYAGRAEAEPTCVVDVSLVCEEKTLENITLSPDNIRSLFMEYIQHYHPILPLVDVAKGPEKIYRLCPALFWVIMFVALRRYDDDKSLLLSLSPLVKTILAEISISPITRYNPSEEDEPIMNACSVYSVQAFILYSLWPPLTSSLSADSSWNTIGVALFHAIRIGLHSSGQLLMQEKESSHSQQYKLAQEQMRTWIMCNIVSQNIATAFGFPAFVQFDYLPSQLCDIPILTRHIMEIAHFEDQVAKTLTMGTFSETGFSHMNEKLALVKVLLKQLDDLEIKLHTECNQEDGHRKFHYIVARIHLLTFYLMDTKNIPPFELSKGLVSLFNCSLSLITHVSMCDAKYKDFVKYLPVVSILHIWQASCIIVKLANSPLKNVIDVEPAKETYLTAIRLVAKASVLRHDISYRASGIMRNMWQLFRSLDESNMSGLALKIKSRMTASVFFDCLSLLRDKVGMAKLNIGTDVREQSEDRAASNDDDDDEDDDDARYADGSASAVVSEDENGAQQVAQSESRPSVGESQKGTPGSNGSSGRIRKKRTLSGVHDAESKARRIIQTIPLDPQPIAAPNRSSIFKVVNSSTNSSPNTSVKAATTSPASGGVKPTTGTSTRSLGGLGLSVTGIAVGAEHSQQLNATKKDDYILDDTVGTMDSNLFDVNNDLLWKDVDSLMNDFGFHT